MYPAGGSSPIITIMFALSKSRMTVNKYLGWAAQQPGRFELLEGAVYAMSREGAGHAEIKAAVHAALLSGIRARKLNLYVLPDGMTVRINDATAYEPDPTCLLRVEAPLQRHR